MFKLLLIDDDNSLCYSLKRALSQKYDVYTAINAAQGFELLEQNNFNLIFLDLMLKDENGLDILTLLKEKYPNTPVIMMTAFGTSENIIKAIIIGAEDFIVKPIDVEDLISIIEKYKHIDTCSCGSDFIRIDDYDFKDSQIVGLSKLMQEVLKVVALVSNSDSPVLITGESGTGKELIANLIHKYSHRNKQPYVPINCASIPGNLLESELFGHAKGAFTGAYQSKKGKFEMADKGTVFLDEIGDLPLTLQPKLLRILQNGSIEVVGNSQLKSVDVRIVSATNQKLSDLIRKQQFREDLFYRLNVINIDLPPLRDRTDDIFELTLFFIQKFAEDNNKRITCVEKSVFDKLKSYSWPGNIRELQNYIRKIVILSKSKRILSEDISLDLPKNEQKENNVILQDNNNYLRLDEAVSHLEKDLIIAALRDNGFHLSKTADRLGISRVTLNTKIKKYSILLDN